jgi:hypothetical protein
MTHDNDPQVTVDMALHSILNEFELLTKMRLDPKTAHLLVGCEQQLGSALLAAEALLSTMGVERRPMPRPKLVAVS